MLDGVADAIGEVVDLYMPDEPNMWLIEYTGGTENAAGELEGQAEQRTGIKALVTKPDTNHQVGDVQRNEKGLQARLRQKQLTGGELVEYDGSLYRVGKVEHSKLANDGISWLCQLNEVEIEQA